MSKQKNPVSVSAVTVKLDAHEQLFLSMYRSLPPVAREPIDGLLYKICQLGSLDGGDLPVSATAVDLLRFSSEQSKRLKVLSSDGRCM